MISNPIDPFVGAAEKNDLTTLREMASLVDGEHIAVALLRAAEHGHVDCVRFLLQEGSALPKIKSFGQCQLLREEALTMAAGNGHPQCVGLLLTAVQGSVQRGNALKRAANCGHPQCVHLLLPHCASGAIEAALDGAVRNGHTDCVRKLVAVCGASERMLKIAAAAGHTTCVHALLSRSPLDWRAAALAEAAASGQKACVELLLSCCDPQKNNSWALQMAAEHNQEACVDALWGASDPHAALRGLQDRHPQTPAMWAGLHARIEAIEQHAVLTDVLAPNELKCGQTVRKI